jgi:hypothetical protein
MHRETDFRRLTRPIYRQPRYRYMNLPLGFPAFLDGRPAYYRRKPSILSRLNNGMALTPLMKIFAIHESFRPVARLTISYYVGDP